MNEIEARLEIENARTKGYVDGFDLAIKTIEREINSLRGNESEWTNRCLDGMHFAQCVLDKEKSRLEEEIEKGNSL